MLYKEFVIEFSHKVGDEYKIDVLMSPMGQESGTFQPPENLFDEDESVAQAGERLYEALFRDKVKTCFEASLSKLEHLNIGLRLVLKWNPANEKLVSLHQLPWEILRKPGTGPFLALCRTSISLVRYPNAPQENILSYLSTKIRILAISSQPKGLQNPSLEGEFRELEAISKRNQSIWVEHLPNVTVKKLREKLLKEKREPYNVLHFMGHGGFFENSQQVCRQPNNYGLVVFQKDDGTPQPLKSAEFTDLIRDFRSKLRLITLNCCFSGRDTSKDLNGIATNLILGGFPSVIAMRDKVSTNAAKNFSTAFYKRLAHKDTIETAIIEARFEVKNDVETENEWSQIMLFQRKEWGLANQEKSPALQRNETHEYYESFAAKIVTDPFTAMEPPTPGLAFAQKFLATNTGMQAHELSMALNGMAKEWKHLPDLLMSTLMEKTEKVVLLAATSQKHNAFMKTAQSVPGHAVSENIAKVICLATAISNYDHSKQGYREIAKNLNEKYTIAAKWLGPKKKSFLGWLIKEIDEHHLGQGIPLIEQYLNMLGKNKQTTRKGYIALLKVIYRGFEGLNEDKENQIANLSTPNGRFSKCLKEHVCTAKDLLFFRQGYEFLHRTNDSISTEEVYHHEMIPEKLSPIYAFLKEEIESWQAGIRNGHRVLYEFIKLNMAEEEYWWFQTFDTKSWNQIVEIRKTLELLDMCIPAYRGWLMDHPDGVYRGPENKENVKQEMAYLQTLSSCYLNYSEQLASIRIVTNIDKCIQKEYNRLARVHHDLRQQN